jgi:hypothetical protein
LKEEGIEFKVEDLKTVVQTNYPDIRKMLGILQSNIINNKLELSNLSVATNDIGNNIVDILKSDLSKRDKFVSIRKFLLDNETTDYINLYSLLYTRIDEYGTGNIAPIILEIADGQNKSAFVVDKEITAMATIIKILDIIG